MADTLKVYKGVDVVGTAERGEDGKAKVTVDGLDANTDYATGTYQVSFSNENGESEKVDVPSFKTKPIAVTGVTIAPKTASVDVDATTKLNSTVAPSTATNKSVSYKSSDEAVATVSSDGTVTGVAEGDATITVTTQDGNKSDTATVTVNAAVINVTGVTVDPETATLEIGETQQLTPTVEPSNASYKAVSFTSSDDAIATVDNDGLVTAVAAGSADITVESLMDGSKTAVCTLTVTAKTIAVTGVAIEPKTATLEIGETQQLTPTVTPENASDKTVTYASNAQGIASVDDNGLITGKAEGTTQIVVTTKDGNKSATCDVTVNPPEPEPEPEVPEEPEE